MACWSIIFFVCALAMTSLVNAKHLQHQKREVEPNICDPVYHNTTRVQCYCVKDSKDHESVRSAECYLTASNVALEDRAWKAFKVLKHAQKISFTNTRGIPLTHVPTNALKEAKYIKKLEIKYAFINTIFSFAFANISHVEEMTLRDNQIVTLEEYAFAHHNALTIISLDTNNLSEINRNVFVDLPFLEKLYLTNNQISTIHDKAFVHLNHLKELEIDRNKVFSLNFATFEGLKNLEKLDMSNNNLEVIGDNTFSALESLKSLNLESNKIQMLDEKAFKGLGKLLSLSLARNKLADIDNEKVFEGLDSLMSLSLRGNQIKELKPAVMAPILNNFYGNNSGLDVEDNNFPCDCRLDWFTTLMNKTLNKHLKNALENFKCLPDAALKETWTKTIDSDKNAQQNLEDEDAHGQADDYEYYDETQLNGRLFYLDVRYLLNCNKDSGKSETATTSLTKDATSPTSLKTTTKPVPMTDTNVDNSLADTTLTTAHGKAEKNKREQNSNDITTTRLATVSAKPVNAKIYDDMASDEAKPDKIKAHRSIQDEVKEPTNSANKILSCGSLLMLIIITLIVN